MAVYEKEEFVETVTLEGRRCAVLRGLMGEFLPV
jgi:hypothetical protein